MRIQSLHVIAMGAYHNGEASTALRDNLVSLVGEIGNANR